MRFLLLTAALGWVAGFVQAQTQFTDAPFFGQASTSSQPACGDLDGDGDLDMVWSSSGLFESEVLYQRRCGRYEVARGQGLPAEAWPGLTRVVDFDGDGIPEVVIASRSNPRGLPIFKRGSTGYRLWTELSGAGAFGIADMDNDGDPDVVTFVGVWINDGRGGFTNHPARMPPRSSLTCSFFLSAADVDQDGYQDVILLGFDCVSVLWNDGRGNLRSEQVIWRGSETPSDVGAFDCDGDDDLDVIVAMSGQGSSVPGTQARLLVQGPGRVFTDETQRLPQRADPTFQVHTGDIDDDGDVDLFLLNWAWFFPSPEVASRLYLNDGQGRFQDTAGIRLPDIRRPSSGAGMLDVDDDGDLDIVVSFPSGSNRVFLNGLRHSSGSDTAALGSSYVLTVSARRGFAVSDQAAVPFVSTLPAMPSIPWPPFGRLGLDPAHAIPLSALLLRAPGGEAAVTIQVPASPALIGQTAYFQSMILHDMPLSSWRLTNVHCATIVR